MVHSLQVNAEPPPQNSLDSAVHLTMDNLSERDTNSLCIDVSCESRSRDDTRDVDKVERQHSDVIQNAVKSNNESETTEQIQLSPQPQTSLFAKTPTKNFISHRNAVFKSFRSPRRKW